MKPIRIHQFILISVSVCCYLFFGYFVQREQFYQIILLYSILFIAFIWLYNLNIKEEGQNFAIRISILFRITLIMMIPNLSNDFYRFIWDGRLINIGLNPYLSLPVDIVENDIFREMGTDARELYEGQGTLSPGNYTCYPPINQFLFFISTFLFPQSILGSVITLRSIIILSDIGTIWLGRKILRKLNLPESNILLYSLNPFIIIELTGNLHFEATTIFFLVLAVYFLLQNKTTLSAVALALSASVKLIPLIFIPVFLRKLGQRLSILYTILVGILFIVLFLPFLSPGLYNNFLSSIDLYFRNFEFNASIYYLTRWFGYQIIGWNIIQKAGPLLGLFVLFFVTVLSIVPKNEQPKKLLESMLFAISIYYFFATTIHPWYIAIPLIVSVFTNYRFVLAWSYLVIFSYSAYQNEGFEENLWLIVLEYSMVYSFMLYELIYSRNRLKKT